ncbi:hypothetical protein NKH98_17685 [Mesorhizobium sp. M0833]|uniref:hypothetical protein n=1 Tax=Mesorhizobium sp. M0833 TaxID=2957009 RepID=UPI00333A348D
MLTSEQINKLQPLVVTNFAGRFADELLANFSFLRVGISLERVTAANSLFDTKVLDFLRSLNGQQVYKALNELKLEYPDNDELESAIDDILKELSAQSPGPKQGQQPPPTLKLLLANGKMEAGFVPGVKKYLQEVMDGWEVITGQLTSNDIDENVAVIALLANFGTQKGVTDPPLSTVQFALQNLAPPRRVVLVSLNRGAFQWVQDRIQTLNRKDVVETESFFYEPDGQPIFFAQAGPFREAEIEYRVKNIGMKLSSMYSLASSQTNANLVAATTGRQPTVPIIVLGEPEGSPPSDAEASIQGLITALKKSGLEFSYWGHGWRNGRPQPTGLLVKDPIFIRTVGDAETNTTRVAQDLERALRSVFDPREAVIDLLLSCRHVLWRPNGPSWGLVGDSFDLGRANDDLDNIETRIAQPDKFVKWLERFVAPDAVIFHEALGEQRPAGPIRMLRETITESLSVPTRKAFVRLRAFKELPNFGDDPLTIVAVDDLPIAAGIDLREKVKSRFDQFRFKIDQILEQKRSDTDGPAVIRIAILTQGAALFQGDPADQSNILRGWKPLRVDRNASNNFCADSNDADALAKLMQQLINGSEPYGPEQ